MTQKLTRRLMLKLAVLGSLGGVAAACQPQATQTSAPTRVPATPTAAGRLDPTRAPAATTAAPTAAATAAAETSGEVVRFTFGQIPTYQSDEKFELYVSDDKRVLTLGFSDLQAEVGLGASPTPAPGGTTTYTVKSGDWLYSIGRQFGVSAYSIAAANNIPPPYTIYPGQVLVIPTPVPTSPAPTSTRVFSLVLPLQGDEKRVEIEFFVQGYIFATEGATATMVCSVNGQTTVADFPGSSDQSYVQTLKFAAETPSECRLCVFLLVGRDSRNANAAAYLIVTSIDAAILPRTQ